MALFQDNGFSESHDLKASSVCTNKKKGTSSTLGQQREMQTIRFLNWYCLFVEVSLWLSLILRNAEKLVHCNSEALVKV